MSEPPDNPLFATAFEIETFCAEQGWQFFFIGGVAVQRWGEPRYTEDVDLTLLTGFGDEVSYIDSLIGRFRGRVPDARQFALRSRVVLLETEGGVPIDVAWPGCRWRSAPWRELSFDIGNGRTITTCSAEDLIVPKAFAAAAWTGWTWSGSPCARAIGWTRR